MSLHKLFNQRFNPSTLYSLYIKKGFFFTDIFEKFKEKKNEKNEGKTS